MAIYPTSEADTRILNHIQRTTLGHAQLESLGFRYSKRIKQSDIFVSPNQWADVEVQVDGIAISMTPAQAFEFATALTRAAARCDQAHCQFERMAMRELGHTTISEDDSE